MISWRAQSKTAARAENVEFLEAVDCRVLFQLDATNLHKDDRVRHEKFDRVNFFSRFLKFWKS
jgi:hypothetical protein